MAIQSDNNHFNERFNFKLSEEVHFQYFDLKNRRDSKFNSYLTLYMQELNIIIFLFFKELAKYYLNRK